MQSTLGLLLVAVTIVTFAEIICESANAAKTGVNKSAFSGMVDRLASMLYHEERTDRAQSELYHPEPSDIDAFRPGCGIFKQHASSSDTNAFRCAGGHRVLPDDTGDSNPIYGKHHHGSSLVRKRRMAGSHKVRAEEAPYYAQIVGFLSNGTPLRNCGGTIIHKNLVLTAAHCMRTLNNATQIGVIVGTNKFAIVGDRMRHDGTLVYVDKHVIERDYKRESYLVNDLALLKLATDLKYNDRVQPACMRLQTVPREDAICLAAGRGSVNRYREFFLFLGGLAMEMDLGHYERPVNETFRWRPLVEGTVCNGDSGSGLVCYDSCDDSGVIRAYLVGVLSSVDPETYVCEERKQSGYYVNLHVMRDRLHAMVGRVLETGIGEM